MAISPPSDIVLDVARAIDPTELAAARETLARKVGAVAPTGTDAAFSLGLGTTPSAGAVRQPDRTDKAQAYRKFESMVLNSFMQNLMPKESEAVYGQGLAGDMWKQMLAEKISDVVADRGGIGIADRLLGDHYMDGETLRPVGAVSSGPERVELDRQTSLSDALIKELQRRVTTDAAEDASTTGVAAGART